MVKDMFIRLLKNREIFAFCILLPFCISCEKNSIGLDQNTEMTALTGDTSVFIGNWTWIYSDHQYGFCDGDFFEEQLTPASENINFRIDFLPIGLIRFYRNESLFSEYRLRFNLFAQDGICSADSYHFGINLDNNDELDFFGCIDSDTALFYCFPGFIFQEEYGCEYYYNYFVKE
jgi:hypothetical protein